MEKSIKKVIAFVLAVILTFSVVTIIKNDGLTASAASASSVSIKKSPTLKAGTVTATSVKLSWTTTKNADSYKLYKSTDKQSWKSVVTTESTSYTVRKMKTGTKYYFKLIAVSGKTKSPYSNTVVVTPKVGKVTNLNISNQGKTNYLKLSWNKVEEVQEYQVYRSDKQNGEYIKINSVTDNTCEDDSVDNNKVYYYKVRAVKTDGQKKLYGSFSNITKGITYVKLNTPKISKVNASYDEITLFWNKQETATGYAVYRKKSNEKEYSRIGLTKNGFFIDNDFRLGKSYSYYIRSYSKANAGKTVRSANSDAVLVETDGLNKIIMDIGGKFVNKKTFKLNWKKNSGVTGYEIIYSNDAELYEKNVKKLYVSGEKNTSLVMKNLIPDMEYFIQVRPYKKDGIVNYLSKSKIMAIKYDEYYTKFYTRNDGTYREDKNGMVMLDQMRYRNPFEYDYDLYCHVCDKKGCTILGVGGDGHPYIHYCFKCKKQILSTDCHPTSHIIYSREHSYGHCRVCGRNDCIRSMNNYYCVKCKKTVKASTCHPASHFNASH